MKTNPNIISAFPRILQWLGYFNKRSPYHKADSLLENQKVKNRCMFNALNNYYKRSDYGYIIAAGAELAKKLDIGRISVLELGVAGGRGLLAMEKIASEVQKEFNIIIDIYGFDSGAGMPQHKDSRDMPHFFKKGNYRMDINTLSANLQSTELILGDVVDTFPGFCKRGVAPIAAIAFDMDYYYPTIEALNTMALGENANKMLPRVFTYFDNTVGDHIKAYNEYAGESLAISDFNATHATEKLTINRHFRNLPVSAAWHHKIYILHLFQHPLYNNYIGSHAPESLRLKKHEIKPRTCSS